MYFKKRYISFALLVSLLTPHVVFAQEAILIAPRSTTPRICDPLTCQLPSELQITERFLRDRKNGLPYTPEPRVLTPEIEVLRLNQLSQTLGYLNLYRAYPQSTIYQDEAKSRVQYFLDRGATALGNGPRDGMVAYMFFEAYDVFRDPLYLNTAIQIADTCLTIPEKDQVMNGGLMCAVGLGAAYHATGNTMYRDAARHVVENTLPKQYPDGAFPHLPSLNSGKNISYTAWMDIELLLLGRFDPQGPYTDFLTLKAANFLSQRIKSDGTIQFSTATENFDADPGNTNAGIGHDVGGFFSIALTQAATGRPDLASKVLRVGFTQRLGGAAYGGYPDVYAAEPPITNIWLSGKPSVLRTSLIFWYMTLFQALKPTCSQGSFLGCTAQSGAQYCLANRYTSCIDVARTAVLSGQACGQTLTCDDTSGAACFRTCTLYGSQICYNGICAGQCSDVNVDGQPEATCTEQCFENRSCDGVTQAPDTESVSVSLQCRAF